MDGHTYLQELSSTPAVVHVLVKTAPQEVTEGRRPGRHTSTHTNSHRANDDASWEDNDNNRAENMRSTWMVVFPEDNHRDFAGIRDVGLGASGKAAKSVGNFHI